MSKLKDISKATKLSMSTISRVLQNSRQVSEKNRIKVLKAAKELGYEVKSPREHNFILVNVPSYDDPFTDKILNGIRTASKQLGYKLVLTLYEENSDIELVTNNINGLVAIVFIGSEILMNNNHTLPCIYVSNFSYKGDQSSVQIDNLTSAFNATEYLIKKGHRNIGQILGNKYSVLVKYNDQGFRQALHRYNITYNHAYNFEGDFDFKSGEDAMKYFLSLPERPSAIFCHSDRMAIGAMKYAEEVGVAVPQEISFIGFQDIPLSEYANPPLTTMDHSLYEMGSQAIKVLHSRLEGKQNISDRNIISTTLIERSSVFDFTQK
ncbi:LacI family DNA-binding transcriptional regulator [Vibrio sp. HN007]|uniref:LacI family DNA-binding transcriptional regulator n=1 Tax=Vibrio iocasae TaxID=3098914 RepID=UPI0035D47861